MMPFIKRRFAPLNSAPSSVDYSSEYGAEQEPGILEQVAGSKSKDLGWDYSCLFFSDADSIPDALKISSSTAQGERSESLYHKHYRDYPYIVATFPSLAAACYFLTHTTSIKFAYDTKVYGADGTLQSNGGRSTTFTAHHAHRITPGEPTSSEPTAEIITPDTWQPAWSRGRWDGRKIYRIRIADPSGWGNHTWSDKHILPDDQRLAIWSQASTNTDVDTAKDIPLEWSRDNEAIRIFGIVKYGESAYGILGNTTYFGGFYWESDYIPDLICSIADGTSSTAISTPFGDGHWHYTTNINLPNNRRAEFSNIKITVS